MRTVTVAEMITRLDTLLEMESDGNVTQAQKIDALNCGLTEFYDYLIASDLSDYFVKTHTFNTVAGTVQYALPADFYKVRQVYVSESDGRFRPLPSVNEWYLQSHRAPDSAVPMRLEYIPCAPVLTAPSDSVDGVNGWEELIVLYAALDICRRKQDEPGWLREKAKKLEARILKMSTRDVGMPDKVIRRRLRDPYGLYNRSTVDGYRLRGSYLEVYRRDPLMLPV